jgi:dolichyl-phosphate beta-glucosyltransferase
MEDDKLLLVIPFYNEAGRMAAADYAVAFRQYPNYDFLLVNDCSTDATASILDDFAKANVNVSVKHLAVNSGKAGAIRQAVLAAAPHNYTYIGYIDADLATPIEEIAKMKAFADQAPAYHFIMGSRIKKMGSTITRYASRHYFGRVFATIVSTFILKTPVYDSQCGAKIIRKDLAVKLFEEPFITRWLFDIELLLRYRKMEEGYAGGVYEYSLATWTEKGGSKISVSDLLGFPLQLIKIYFKYDC